MWSLQEKINTYEHSKGSEPCWRNKHAISLGNISKCPSDVEGKKKKKQSYFFAFYQIAFLTCMDSNFGFS